MFERMRKEFVANVSHELRTPVTSIKGSVETLLDGAIDYPNDARKFLGIIAGQAERLGSIINDLMSLSRIEQEEEKGLIQMEPHNLRMIVHNALEDVQIKAKERSIQIDLVCERDITVTVNDRLLEQAIVNLVDNAINYSDPGSKVIVELSQNDGETIISVRDNGIGISKEHIPRLFERFYRVDRGRSRKQGGTGLGLAIVKHIVNAHGGHTTVESVPGSGSTFTIHIPEKSSH
jgi:two-component system phosphate regulon sensor histidine kinase PhoR